MQLPPSVRRAIEERADSVGFPALKRAVAALSDAYRDGKPARLTTEENIAAYLVTRMPATYAAAQAVLIVEAGADRGFCKARSRC